MERRLAAIMAMDMAGYSRLMEGSGERTFARLKQFQENIIQPAIDQNKGRIVKTMGDGILAEFPSVVGALKSATNIQLALDVDNVGLAANERLEFRIGLHLGDIIVENDDIFGNGVNIAARLESIASPGEVIVSRQAYDHIDDRESFQFEAMGEQQVKNISQPVEVFRVIFREEAKTGNIIYRFDDFEIDCESFELRKQGELVHVEPLVFDMLRYLAENSGRLITRDDIIEHVWNGRIVSDATVSSCIKFARKALGDSGSTQKYLRTIRGRGIQFSADLRKDSIKESVSSAAQESAETARAPRPAQLPCSLAILPLDLFGGDTELESLADGLVENLTTVLTRVPFLQLASRKSAFSLKRSELDAQAIGRKLGVKFMLEGSLQNVVDKLRLNVQLIETANGFHLWAQQFDQPLDDKVFENFLNSVIQRLEPQLIKVIYNDCKSDDDELSGKQLLIQAVSLLSLKGWHQSTFEEASNLLRLSIDREPDTALAHSFLALVLGLGHRFSLLSRSDSVKNETISAAEQALDLDDLDSMTISIAACALADVGQPMRAIPLLRRSLDINPNNGHAWAALGSALAIAGQMDKAAEPLERGIQISPMDNRLAIWRAALALIYLHNGDTVRALETAETALQDDDKSYLPKVAMTAIYLSMGQARQAAAMVKETLRVKPDVSADEIVCLVGRKAGSVIASMLPNDQSTAAQ